MAAGLGIVQEGAWAARYGKKINRSTHTRGGKKEYWGVAGDGGMVGGRGGRRGMQRTCPVRRCGGRAERRRIRGKGQGKQVTNLACEFARFEIAALCHVEEGSVACDTPVRDSVVW